MPKTANNGNKNGNNMGEDNLFPKLNLNSNLFFLSDSMFLQYTEKVSIMVKMFNDIRTGVSASGWYMMGYNVLRIIPTIIRMDILIPTDSNAFLRWYVCFNLNVSKIR